MTKKYTVASLRYEAKEYREVVKAIRRITGKRSPNVSGWIKALIAKEINSGTAKGL
jgi:hypothetical protein